MKNEPKAVFEAKDLQAAIHYLTDKDVDLKKCRGYILILKSNV